MLFKEMEVLSSEFPSELANKLLNRINIVVDIYTDIWRELINTHLESQTDLEIFKISDKSPTKVFHNWLMRFLPRRVIFGIENKFWESREGKFIDFIKISFNFRQMPLLFSQRNSCHRETEQRFIVAHKPVISSILLGIGLSLSNSFPI